MLFRLKSEVPADTNFRGEKSKKKLRVWIGNSGNAVGPCLLVGEIINLFRHIQEFTAFFGTGFSRDKKEIKETTMTGYVSTFSDLLLTQHKGKNENPLGGIFP